MKKKTTTTIMMAALCAGFVCALSPIALAADEKCNKDGSCKDKICQDDKCPGGGKKGQGRGQGKGGKCDGKGGQRAE